MAEKQNNSPVEALADEGSQVNNNKQSPQQRPHACFFKVTAETMAEEASYLKSIKDEEEKLQNIKKEESDLPPNQKDIPKNSDESE